MKRTDRPNARRNARASKNDKRHVVDLAGLPPETRERVERAIRPRDTVFSRRFHRADMDAWARAAARAGESVTDWVERTLNHAAEERR